MFSEQVNNFPSRSELRQLCEAIMSLSPVIKLGDHLLTVHLLTVNNFQPHQNIAEHSHGFYEVLVTLSGEAEYNHEDFRQPIVPGTVLVFRPLAPHSWQTLDDPHQSFAIWFDITPPISLPTPVRWPIRLSLILELEQLFQDVSAREAGWDHRAIARLTIILSSILIPAKWDPMRTVDGQDHPFRLVQMIDLFLNDNIGQKVTLSDIAVHLSSSVRRITRDYRRITGKSIMERLLELRMKRAAELLTNTDLTLSVIGDQVGISDPSYFCRCFRSAYGSSPGIFRNKELGF